MSGEQYRERVAASLSSPELSVFGGRWDLKVAWEHRWSGGSRSARIKTKPGKQLGYVL